MISCSRRRVALLVAAALVLFVPPASAQTPLSLGVLGGVTVGNLDLPLDLLPADVLDPAVTISQGTRIAFAGGFFVAKPFTSRALFETGALVSSKGTGITLSEPSLGSISGALQLTYLD